ncbi:MAG: hypothetical protein A2428_11565 [Bdellovibrionales bacterium RIFOXYC1_FULL_54_43]|nr:MAG: hypothetical protein A2428_11565 [Bdellovibrionales bacterium RIFOXYC1_FULL_54_43]OFZ82780.1 MAG: hypothetical protein A2603_04940 [Bdellovibrionales bacterium RIFOXYD1_FULL_55_31]
MKKLCLFFVVIALGAGCASISKINQGNEKRTPASTPSAIGDEYVCNFSESGFVNETRVRIIVGGLGNQSQPVINGCWTQNRRYLNNTFTERPARYFGARLIQDGIIHNPITNRDEPQINLELRLEMEKIEGSDFVVGESWDLIAFVQNIPWDMGTAPGAWSKTVQDRITKASLAISCYKSVKQ